MQRFISQLYRSYWQHLFLYSSDRPAERVATAQDIILVADRRQVPHTDTGYSDDEGKTETPRLVIYERIDIYP